MQYKYKVKKFWSYLVVAFAILMICLRALIAYSTLEELVLPVVILIIVYLVKEIFSMLFGVIEIDVNSENIIIKKKIFNTIVKKQTILYQNIKSINLFNDYDSNKTVGFPGINFHLKYDYCIELILVKSKKVFFEIKNKQIGNSIYSSILSEMNR